MIRFENWTIQEDDELLARQFDNLTRTLIVTGEIPSEWDWDMLVQVQVQGGVAMDIIPLTLKDGNLSADLTAQQLSIAGYYQMQLRATQGSKVLHTNTIRVRIPGSLSGDEQWPTIPSEFTQLEQRVKAEADRAKAAADRAEGAGGSEGGPGGYYSPNVTQPTADTMQVSYTRSSSDMPSVAPVTVTLPAGKDGAAGAQGPAGYTPKKGVDYYTEADKQEMVDAILNALPAAEGVAY